MKINKILLTNSDFKIQKSSNEVQFVENDTNLTPKEVFAKINDRIVDAIQTHVNTVKKSNRPQIQKFLNDEQTLYDLFEQTFNYEQKIKVCDNKYYNNWTGKNKDKIVFDEFDTSINIFYKYKKICSYFDQKDKKTLEPYEKFYVPEILNAIETKLGKNFLKYVGNIFANRNLTISEILREKNSYVQVLQKSILANKIKTDNVNLPLTIIEEIFTQIKAEDLIDNITKVLKIHNIECLFKGSNNLNDLNVKKCQKKAEKRNNTNEKCIRMIISNLNDFLYKRCKNNENYCNQLRGLRKKVMKMIGDDFRYIINQNQTKQKWDANLLCKELVKIANDKLEILKKPNLNFVLMETYYKPSDNIFTQEHKIISHSIFKLYKNLAVIVGANIINYNQNSNEQLYDFSENLNDDVMEKYLNNFNIWNGENFKQNYKKDYIASSIIMRNMIMHQKKFGKWNENEQERKYVGSLSSKNILEKIKNNYNKRKDEILKSYNISPNENAYLKLFDYDEVMISISFKRFFKKALNNTQKNNEVIKLINDINSAVQTNSDSSHKANAQKYLLKLAYNNNFQVWLTNPSNKFKPNDFKQWYKINATKDYRADAKLSFPVNNECSYFRAQNIFEIYVSKWDQQSTTKKKEESLNKRKSLIEYFTLYCFEQFIKSQNGIINDIKELRYKELSLNEIKCEDEIVEIFILSSLNLSNFELSRLINILENFINRIYKNKAIKKEYEKNYQTNWYFNEQNILNIITYLKMLIESTDELVSWDPNQNLIPNILKNYEDENFNANSSSNQYKLLQYYANGVMHKNIIERLNEKWETLGFHKIDVFSKNELVLENETKVQQIERSKNNNVSNGQAIINALKLYNEINYWAIRWVMYREFYYYQQIKGLDSLFNVFNNCSVKKLLKREAENPQVAKKLNEINNQIKQINTKIEEINLVKYEKLKSEEINCITTIEEFEDKKIEVNNLQDKFKNCVNEFDNKSVAAQLSQIMHFEQYKEGKKRLTFIKLINKLRKIHDFSRNNKNMITPSLKKIFDKHKIILDFSFLKHDIISYELSSKQIEIKEQNKPIDLLSEEELKLYNFILDNFDL